MSRFSLSLTFLVFMTVIGDARASSVFVFNAPALSLRSALASLKQLTQFSCDVFDQDSSKDAQFCGKSNPGAYRCFADVRYENGKDLRVWGSTCYTGFSECWWNGPGAINPCK